jgi:hypothetical protein
VSTRAWSEEICSLIGTFIPDRIPIQLISMRIFLHKKRPVNLDLRHNYVHIGDGQETNPVQQRLQFHPSFTGLKGSKFEFEYREICRYAGIILGL